MAAATTKLSPSTAKASSAGDSAHKTAQRIVAGQSTPTNMEQSSYPDPTPSEQYPSPMAARMAQAAASYDTQAPQSLIADSEITHEYVNGMTHGLSQGFVGHDGSELSNGHGRGHSASHRYPPSTPHATGRPTTPQQQIAMVGQHTGMDPNQDLSLSNESSRRKRSKVSRACDECRRKKIKCDAIREDGSHQTCNNCKRGQTHCTFDRVPQKRGPSKGYIQELSNRVQQIESQAQAQEMRMSQLGALPAALRASLDATGDGARMYTPEGYSSAPDEAESLNIGQKRKFSELQDGQATSPFTQTRFTNHEQIPSLSGWSMNAQLPNNSTNSNQRHSISIAPDQTIENTDMDQTSYEIEEPFWVQNSFKPARLEPRSHRVEDPVEFPSIQESVQELHEQVKAVFEIFSFLPQTPLAFNHHISSCDNETCYTFATALDVVTNKTRQSERLQSMFGGSYRQFEHHIRAKALPLQFGARPVSANFVWLWTLILMILHTENDLSRVRQRFDDADGKLTVLDLIRMAIKLCAYLLEITDSPGRPMPDEEPDSNGNLVRRAWSCVAVLAAWTEIGNGVTDLIPYHYRTTVGNGRDQAILGPVLFYLSGASVSIAQVYRALVNIDVHQAALVRLSTGPSTHQLLMGFINVVGSNRPLPSEFEPYLDATTAYFELLISRSTLSYDVTDVLQKTLLLVNEICSARFVNANYQEAAGFPFFTNHFFNLAVITLLELGTASTNPHMNEACHKSIQALQLQLEKLVRSVNTNMPTDGVFWADGLLKLIEMTPIRQSKDLQTVEKQKTPALDFPRLARKGTSECVAEAIGV